jgi:hypothetical protein
VRAEAEPILPPSVPASRRAFPGLGDEMPEPRAATEPPPVSAPRDAPPLGPAPESLAPPTPPAGSIEEAPPSQPLDSESSGVHSVAGATPLQRPRNRDELLARLRERKRAPEPEPLDAGAAAQSKG